MSETYRVTVTLDSETYQQLKREAGNQKRSMSGQIAYLLKERYQKAQSDDE